MNGTNSSAKHYDMVVIGSSLGLAEINGSPASSTGEIGADA